MWRFVFNSLSNLRSWRNIFQYNNQTFIFTFTCIPLSFLPMNCVSLVPFPFFPIRCSHCSLHFTFISCLSHSRSFSWVCWVALIDHTQSCLHLHLMGCPHCLSLLSLDCHHCRSAFCDVLTEESVWYLPQTIAKASFELDSKVVTSDSSPSAFMATLLPPPTSLGNSKSMLCNKMLMV